MTNRLLNSVLLLTLSIVLVFPIVFSGLVISPGIMPETGIVLGTFEKGFGGNLRVSDISKDGLTKRVEFTIFPGQETYYRDFVKVTNESGKEKRFGIRLVEVEEGISQDIIELSFRGSRSEVVLSPGESVFLNLVIHGSSVESPEPLKTSLTFTVHSKAN